MEKDVRARIQRTASRLHVLDKMSPEMQGKIFPVEFLWPIDDFTQRERFSPWRVTLPKSATWCIYWGWDAHISGSKKMNI
jgi:hypothetical protein